MMKLSHNETYKIAGGWSRLRAWEPGALEYFMNLGYSLSEAQRLAKKRHLMYDNTKHNLVVVVGRRLVGDILIDSEPVGFTYLAVGTSFAVPTVNDTGLNAEYFRKAITSRTRPGTATYITLSTFFVANQVSVNLQEAGIFGGHYATTTPGSGVLFSHWLQAYDNSVVQNDLTYDYILDILA